MSRLKIWDAVTGNWQYAGSVDPVALANDPAFRQALASNPALIAALAASLVPASTVWPTAATAGDPGWIFMTGQTIANADALYPSLWSRIPAGWKSGTSLLVPDMRGRVIMGAGTGAGLTARALGAILGEENHALTAAESGMPAHTPTASSTAGATGNTSVDHYHLIGGITGNNNQGHRHGTAVVEYYAYVSSGATTTVTGNGGSITLNVTYAASTGYDIDAHNHNNAANTGYMSAVFASYNHSHPAPGVTTTVNQVAAQNAAAAHNVIQPSFALNWQMKVH